MEKTYCFKPRPPIPYLNHRNIFQEIFANGVKKDFLEEIVRPLVQIL